MLFYDNLEKRKRKGIEREENQSRLFYAHQFRL